MNSFVFSPLALLRHLGLAILLWVLVAPARAQPWSLPASFFDSYYRQSDVTSNTDDDALSLATRSLSKIQARGFSSKSFLGWRPSNFYGAEFTYQRLPETVFQPFAFATSARHGNAAVSMPITLNAYAPFSNRTELTGRLGYLLNTGQGSAQICFDPAGRAYSCQNTPITFGLGVRYELRDRFGVRLDYDYTELKDASIGSRGRSSFFSLGADYRY